MENIQRERPHVPTFVPTLIPAAFVPLHFRHKVDTRLPNWLGGCDQANTPTKRTERGSSPRANRTANEKWERCIQKWNSLLAEHIIINEPERAEGSEEAEGARQVAPSHAPAHLRAKILLTHARFTGHNALLTRSTTDLGEYFRVHRHKYEKYPGFYSPSARRGVRPGPGQTSLIIDVQQCRHDNGFLTHSCSAFIFVKNPFSMCKCWRLI